MAKKKDKTDPYATQAGNLTTIRYGPEISALTALLRQAEDDRDLRLRQAQAGRQYSVGAVDQARPMVQRAYQGAQAAVQPAFAQGGGIESSALQARLGESQALADSQLAARRVSAFEGEGAARSSALRDFRSDRGKIGQRATDLARESGAFSAQTITDLTGADAKATADAEADLAGRTQSERNALIGAGLDPDTGNILPGHEPAVKPNKGKGWDTAEAQSAASDEIDRLITAAKDYKAGGEQRPDVEDLLAHGAEPVSKPVYETVDDGRGGTKRQPVLNPDGTVKTEEVEGLDPAKSKLLLTAALDQAYDGHLSRRTQRLLHARGIKLEPLGLTTFQQWLQTPEGQAWKRRNRQRPLTSPAQAVPGIGDATG